MNGLGNLAVRDCRGACGNMLHGLITVCHEVGNGGYRGSYRPKTGVRHISISTVSTERFLRSGNAGFTKSRRVIGEHVSHPLVGWRTSDQDGWGLRSNLICRGIFEDFHAGSKGNLYSKIATPRYLKMCNIRK